MLDQKVQRPQNQLVLTRQYSCAEIKTMNHYEAFIKSIYRSLLFK